MRMERKGMDEMRGCGEVVSEVAGSLERGMKYSSGANIIGKRTPQFLE
jgi:hypothetical protein